MATSGEDKLIATGALDVAIAVAGGGASTTTTAMAGVTTITISIESKCSQPQHRRESDCA